MIVLPEPSLAVTVMLKAVPAVALAGALTTNFGSNSRTADEATEAEPVPAELVAVTVKV